MVNAGELQAAAEAILFSVGEPIELEKIAEALEIETETAEQILMNLAASLEERNSGIMLLKLGEQYQLSSKSIYAPQIRNVMELKRNTPLSPAAFEVLAVVAYNQPITKAYIEQVRGVDCAGVIATLCQKKLIEEKGRMELPGRPLLYGTTTEFLRCFSISSLDELPPLPEHCENEAEDDKQDAIEGTITEDITNNQDIE